MYGFSQVLWTSGECHFLKEIYFLKVQNCSLNFGHRLWYVANMVLETVFCYITYCNCME
jgi:hypothetical protein